MSLREIHSGALRCFAITLVATAVYAVEARAQQPADSAVPSIDQLVAACEAAQDDFVPRTDSHLAEAKAELMAAISRLDRMLLRSGASGEGWRRFLGWDQQQEQLERRGGPDLEALDAVYAQYASGHPGLNLRDFADVRRALRRYLTTARAIGSETLAEHYRTLLDALPKHLKAYQEKPTTEGALAIGAAVTWLEDAGQAPELVAAIRRYFSQPNLFIQVSADFVAAGIARPVDRSGPVNEVIRGTRVTGTEHTVGQVTVELIPRDDFAEIDTIFTGRIASDTVGRNGPAVVYSESSTGVATRKAIKIDAERIWTERAQTNARTSMRINSVQTTRGGGLVAQQARQQVQAQKRQSELDAARRTEQRTNQRIDEEVDTQIAQLAANYQEKFREPLLKRDLFPQLLRFHSTEQALHATALHGGLTGLGAAAPPPAIENGHDMVVRLHESMLNNFAAASLGGMIVAEETLRTQLTDLVGSTPTWLEFEEEKQPWTITFARRSPLCVTFADQGFVVALRGHEYYRGDTAYPGMNVTAEYKIERTDQGIKAIRQGDLQVFPPGFKPGGDKQLSARQQVLRTLLEERFGNMFTPEIVPEPIALSGNWEAAGELTLTDWTASDGWTVLTWQRTPKPNAEATAAPPSEPPPKTAPKAP